MRANGSSRSNEEETSRSSASASTGRAATPFPPLLALQSSVGNAAVVQMLRRAGHIQEQDRHEHDAECGHQQAEPPVQRSTVPDVLRSPGRPLDDDTRAEMERGLGADFSDVRVHTGEAARRSAAEIDARAYTSGSHVVLGEGGTDRHTLAHELTHVVQQRRGAVSGSDTGQGFQVSDPADKFEREADATASRVVAQASPVPAAPAPSSSGATGRQQDTGVQRAPNKKRKLGPAPGQGTLMQFGVTAPLAAEQERAGASDEAGRKAMFIAALTEKFRSSGEWTVSANGKYAIRNETQSGPHDYQNEPEVESLRWISTVMKRYLIADGMDPTEVQAAIGDKGDLIISTNKKEVNEYLNKRLGDGRSLIGTALESGPVTEQGWEKERPAGSPSDEKSKEAAVGRERRHFEKLGLLTSQEDAEVSARYRRVLDAFGTGVVVASDGDPGLHAERRIKIRNGNKTPDYLAGTKRPCATCFSELYPEASEGDIDNPNAVRPGIFFFDEWSNVGIPEYQDSLTRTPSQRANDMFNRINKKVPRTHVSKAKNGAIVRGTGSDSD
ncbi:DUF4157 domain-containing protein [Streptomyces sp. 4F14]|uniref:eCIS core domain-containing protein n=1 Tax=Streptomyces sp. 4F14 TaxID=3394380 RepID=UPI003A89E208